MRPQPFVCTLCISRDEAKIEIPSLAREGFILREEKTSKINNPDVMFCSLKRRSGSDRLVLFIFDISSRNTRYS